TTAIYTLSLHDALPILTFGESSLDEMCYLVGYIRGKEGAFGCTGKPFVPDDAGAPDASVADAAPLNCKPAANSIGVGGACTAGRSEGHTSELQSPCNLV